MRAKGLLPKISIETIIKAILVRPHVPTDEEILAEIHIIRPDSKINEVALRMYKSCFRSGKMAGMDGKCHDFNQPRLHMAGFRTLAKQRRRRKVRCYSGGCDYCMGKTDKPIFGVPQQEDVAVQESNPQAQTPQEDSQPPFVHSPEAAT